MLYEVITNFWPSITQTADGEVYLVDGARTSMVRIDRLDTIRRIPPVPVRVTAEDLEASQAWVLAAESQRQKDQGRVALTVALRDRNNFV